MSKKKPSKPALVNRQVFKDQLKQTPVAERQRILKQFFESAGCTLPGYSLKRAHAAADYLSADRPIARV